MREGVFSHELLCSLLSNGRLEETIAAGSVLDLSDEVWLICCHGNQGVCDGSRCPDGPSRWDGTIRALPGIPTPEIDGENEKLVW